MDALQDIYGKNGICYGCGVKNEKGLQIKTFYKGDIYINRYRPKKEHQAFPGAINGGIIGSIFDCHSNWSAAHSLFKLDPENGFPVTVTSSFTVKLKKPTPYKVELITTAKIVKIEGNRVEVEAQMQADNVITAIFTGVFYKIKEGHPAYHRWD